MLRLEVNVKSFLICLSVLVAILISVSCARHTSESVSEENRATSSTEPNESIPRMIEPDHRESHFSSPQMLTDGGENAEAYFSFGSDRLIFQSTRPPFGCDQIFVMDIDGSNQTVVSTGQGRTTCSYFLPGDERILYSSTHVGNPDCPPKPDFSRGYVWPIEPNYDVFTSTRDGDLDIYAMNIDGIDVVRLTDEIGYDGGPFFSPDGTKIVYRARHPSDPNEVADYQSLLAEGLIRPSKLEVWVMEADGSDKRQITDLGVAAFGPFFHPSGDRIIFSSNYGDPSGREFELFMVGLDGAGLEQITFSEGFDGFPMWAPDVKTFVFCSNRHNTNEGETNIFLTTWKD